MSLIIIFLRGHFRWLYTWHKIGLDSKDEAFDIILMTHPESVKKLPEVEICVKTNHLQTNYSNMWSVGRSALKYLQTLTLSYLVLVDVCGENSLLCQVLVLVPPAPLVLRTERDHRYDKYLNSQECLFNPAASFLLKYRSAVQKLASVWSQDKKEVPEIDPLQRLLMRADLDTFPTPGLLGWWPTDLICNRNAATTHFR